MVELNLGLGTPLWKREVQVGPPDKRTTWTVQITPMGMVVVLGVGGVLVATSHFRSRTETWGTGVMRALNYALTWVERLLRVAGDIAPDLPEAPTPEGFLAWLNPWD